MSTSPASRPATHEDVVAPPPHAIDEIEIDIDIPLAGLQVGNATGPLQSPSPSAT